MIRKVLAGILAGTVLTAPTIAAAEPVKIALIETLSGGQAVTGKLFQTAVKYGLAKLEADKVWPDGIQLLEYDNQGGPSEAADKLKAAINDGARIIIQGASSAIGGQITADVQKHNARNPGKEIIWINVGAEAMEFTGSKCHFYHFRWNGNAEIRLKAMLIAIVLISILNVMIMAVYERVREIGTIAAIGTLPGKILSLFLVEGLLLGIAGALVGLVVSLAIIFGLHLWKLSFNFGQNVGLILEPTIDPLQVAIACAMVIGVSILASLQPAYKASRMEPIDALRHV